MPRRALALAVLAATLLALTSPARADTSDDKKRQVAQIADRIEQLGDQAASLGQAINGAQLAVQDADGAIAESEKRLAALESKLGDTRSSMAGFALKAYVYADQMAGISALVAGTSMADGSAQREGYNQIAMGGTLAVTDDLGALIEDANRERQLLADRKAARGQALKNLVSSKDAAEEAQAKQQDLFVKTKGELATLLEQERQRRAEAAAAASRAQAQAALAAQQASAARAAVARAAAATPSAPGPAASGGGASASPKQAPATARAEPNIPDIPATSAGAATAVRVALSQLGVPYRFATASPGVNFDCSGLTMWAWAQAGVSMGHYTVTQYNTFPHVPLDQLQPGDIVFFYSDLGHNGMYIGNGQFVHAPRTGDVVKVSPLSGRDLVGAVRPG